ncbi:NAD(P)/FAD-dependent oxidoreductase [Pelagirhabdus alkalitolerans]|uniref:NAD(P)/FAD-dependent oxidoreductase n=1 Tax=Pelagirhabdus alkalitolerans TaxID=1612202 RepID=UPI000B8A5D49|nr:NAD(P)/FAD-dependent oxidoreductase [Pelagirhabdus alkalitolerans]
MNYDVVVIGGGPSGLMAAIASAEQGANTLLIEKGKKLGKKLEISGGGRCNVTSRLPKDEIIKHIPGNGRFLYSAFSVFDNEDIIDFFEDLGVKLKEEDHGRMFPVSDSAKDVVKALINQLDNLNVTVKMQTKVEAIDFRQDHHTVILDNDEKIQVKNIVVAVGGKAVPYTGSTGDGYSWAKKAGHTITTLFPTEVPLKSNQAFIKNKALQGLSLRDVALTVKDSNDKSLVTHTMDMIFTHFGISGPAVLRCSQYVVKQWLTSNEPVKLLIDALPNTNEETLFQTFNQLMEQNPKKSIKNNLKGWVPERYFLFLLKETNIDPDINSANISREKIRALVEHLKRFEVYVHDSLPIEKAFVTGGGVSIKEVIPTTLASKLMEGLFFCGEILDIHGYTGGYNITSALVTGRLAGQNAAWNSF